MPQKRNKIERALAPERTWLCTTNNRRRIRANDLLARGWAALPPSYRIPDTPPTLAEARAWCKHLAETHYENFHVASWFLPEALRPHFHAIYAYCRVSDDLGDEVGNTEQSLALLDLWGRELDACYEGRARHPVFVALAETIRVCNIPKEPFADLLTAFRQDQTVTRYANMDEVLHYCRFSANPVGRLVLYTCGYSDEERFRLSDATCTALQLANFWQDVRVDFAKDRVYIPQADMQRFGVTDATIRAGNRDPRVPRSSQTRSRICAQPLPPGPAPHQHGQPRSRSRSRSVQPRRPRNSQRHRASGL